MLGNLICWMFAISLIFTRTTGREDFYIKLMFAMGFIFLGILCKAVDVYRDTHMIEDSEGSEDSRQ